MFAGPLPDSPIRSDPAGFILSQRCQTGRIQYFRQLAVHSLPPGHTVQNTLPIVNHDAPHNPSAIPSAPGRGQAYEAREQQGPRPPAPPMTRHRVNNAGASPALYATGNTFEARWVCNIGVVNCTRGKQQSTWGTDYPGSTKKASSGDRRFDIVFYRRACRPVLPNSASKQLPNFLVLL